MENVANLEIKKTTFNFSVPDTLYAFEKDPDSSYFKVGSNKLITDEEHTLTLDENTKLYSDIDLFSYLEGRFNNDYTIDDYATNTNKTLNLNQVYAYWFYNNYEKTDEITTNGSTLYGYKRKNTEAIFLNVNHGLNYWMGTIPDNYPNKIVCPDGRLTSSTDSEYFNYLFRYNTQKSEYEPIGYNNVTCDFLPSTSYNDIHFFKTYEAVYDNDKKIYNTIKIPKSSYKGQIMYYPYGDKLFAINLNSTVEDLSSMKEKCYFDEGGIILCENEKYYSKLEQTTNKIQIEDRLSSFLYGLKENNNNKVYEINIFDNEKVNLYVNINSQLKKVFYNNFYISNSKITVNYNDEFKYVTSIGEQQFKYDFSDINALLLKPDYLEIKFYYQGYSIGYTDYIPCNYEINNLGENILTINYSDDVDNPIKKDITWRLYFSGGMLRTDGSDYINGADGSGEEDSGITKEPSLNPQRLKRADLYCNYLKSNDVGALFHCTSIEDLLKHGIVSFVQQTYKENSGYKAGYIHLKNLSYYSNTDVQYCNIVMRDGLDYQMKIDFYYKNNNSYDYLFSSNLMTISFKESQEIQLINNTDNTELSTDKDNIFKDCVTIPKIKIQLSQKNNLSYGQYYLYQVIDNQKKLIKTQDINFYKDLNGDENIFYYNDLSDDYVDRNYILQVVAYSIENEEIKSPAYSIKILKNEIQSVLEENGYNNAKIKNENQISFKNFTTNICDINIDKQEVSSSISYNSLPTILYSETFEKGAGGSLCFEINRKNFLIFCDNESIGEHIIFQYSNSDNNGTFKSQYKLSLIKDKDLKQLKFFKQSNDGSDWEEITSIMAEKYYDVICADDIWGDNCYFIIYEVNADESLYQAGLSLNPWTGTNFVTIDNDDGSIENIYGTLDKPVDATMEFTEIDSIVKSIFYVSYLPDIPGTSEPNSDYYYIKDWINYYGCFYEFITPINFEKIKIVLNNNFEQSDNYFNEKNYFVKFTFDNNAIIKIMKNMILINEKIKKPLSSNEVYLDLKNLEIDNFDLSPYLSKTQNLKDMNFTSLAVEECVFNENKTEFNILSNYYIEDLTGNKKVYHYDIFTIMATPKKSPVFNILVEDYLTDYSNNKIPVSVKNYIVPNVSQKDFIENLNTVIIPGHGYNFYARGCEKENSFDFKRTNLFYSIKSNPDYIGEYIRVIFLNDTKNTYSNYSLGDEFAFECNIEQGTLTQNFEKAALDNYSKYPKFSVGNKNYFTGNINCLLGDVKYRENESAALREYRSSIELSYAYYEEIDVYNKWLENIASGKPVLIIDQKGRTFVSQITDNSVNMFTPYEQKPSQISFSFTECDDFANIKILEVS